jgi:hypothetical protein
MANESDPNKATNPGSGGGKTEPGSGSSGGSGGSSGSGKGGQGGAAPAGGYDEPPQIKIVIAAAAGGLIGGLLGALIGHCIRA